MAPMLALLGCAHLERVEIAVDGEDRSYYEHAPADLRPGAPVVVVLHGGGLPSDHRGRRMSPLTGFDRLADREGFVAVFPNALGGNWRADREDRDQAYVAAVLDRVVADTGADPRRILLVGFSNGGFLAQDLACSRPDRFAAVATVSASLAAGRACAPASPLPVLMIDGTADPVVRYGGGAVARNRGQSEPVEDVVSGWVARNGCADPPVARDWDDRVPDGTRIAERDWCGGTEREVRLLRVDGGGHAWPGGPPLAPRVLVGRVSEELDATEEIWRWFTAGAVGLSRG